MARTPRRIVLGRRLHLRLRDGSQLIIRAGPYGKGLTIVPVNRRHPGTRDRTPTGAPRDRVRPGRPPRPGTVALRRRLSADLEADRLAEPASYVQWLVDTDDVSVATARTVVYRELRHLRDA